MSDDVPDIPREYGGIVYDIKDSNSLDTLEDWNSDFHVDKTGVTTQVTISASCFGWEYAGYPPNVSQIRGWLRVNVNTDSPGNSDVKQISQVKSL